MVGDYSMQKPEAKIKNIHMKVIKELRGEKGVSQRELAGLLGISQTRVAHLESGRDTLTEEVKFRILRALKITPAEFEIILRDRIKGFNEFDLLVLKLQKLSSSKLKLVNSLIDEFLKE